MEVSTSKSYKSNWQSLNFLLSDRSYSFDSRRIPNLVVKGFRAAIQAELLLIFKKWFLDKGRVYPSWTLKLKNNHRDWFPVPDLTYVSYERLSDGWMLDECCPIAPEFIIEIVEKNQKLDPLVTKVADYLQSGVLGVFLINSYSQTVTIATQNQCPQTFTGDMMIENQFLEGLNLTANSIFEQAGLS